MSPRTAVAVGTIGALAAVGVVAWLTTRSSGPAGPVMASATPPPPPLDTEVTAYNPARVTMAAPTYGFDLCQRWESCYDERFEAAVAAAVADPSVVSFDAAVLFCMMQIFGRTYAEQAWWQPMHKRMRDDLTAVLGDTEVEVRAKLTAPTVGVDARRGGADIVESSLRMGERAFPTADWRATTRLPWQRAFLEQAMAHLRA